MLVVGLTGGIGCGKSVVADIFQQEFNIPIIDADVIARDLAKTKAVTDKIRQLMGNEFFDSQDILQRDKLRQAVFADKNLRKRLETILHPLVYLEIENKLKTINADYCIVVIPLLFETERNKFIDRVLVVDCPVEQQIERVMKRDQCTKQHVQDIISTQIERNERLKLADDVIENFEELASLNEKIAILHKKYTQDCTTKIKK